MDYTKLGEQEGYVTVYPSGVNGWNIGSHDAYSVKRRTSDADDVGFFRAMFDTLIEEGVADPKRIYVTGGSNGGVMTQFLVCHLADRIAGAGVMVATLPAAVKDWPKPARPIPIIIMLGTVDPMKPWNGNADQTQRRRDHGVLAQTKRLRGRREEMGPARPRPERRLPRPRAALGRQSARGLLHDGRPRPRLADAERPRRNRHRPQDARHLRAGGVLEVPQTPLAFPTMNNHLACLGICLLSMLMSARSPAASPSAGQGLSSGDHTRTITVGNLQRRYWVHVPKKYDADHPTPVIVVFHGGGGNPESMVRLTGMNAKSEEAGFIVVYPYGSGALKDHLLTFNGGGCCGYAMQNKIDDVGFTRALLDDLAKVANVDTNRVFATGLSNGGIMAYYLASELSDRIAAIAPVGGPLMMDACRPRRAFLSCTFTARRMSSRRSRAASAKARWDVRASLSSAPWTTPSRTG